MAGRTSAQVGPNPCREPAGDSILKRAFTIHHLSLLDQPADREEIQRGREEAA